MNLAGFLTVALDGFAFGMLLLLFSIGLGATLGLPFINLAHGAFAIRGGYLTPAPSVSCGSARWRASPIRNPRFSVFALRCIQTVAIVAFAPPMDRLLMPIVSSY